MTTLFDRIWKDHVVVSEPDAPAVLYVDLHLIHEVTSPQAFAGLRARGLRVRRPDRTVATLDHGVPTDPTRRRLLFVPGSEGRDEQAATQLALLGKNCAEHGIQLFGLDSDKQGIVHVIGPELGLTQPGMTIVCGDSHTSTHGAFGALAFGIGTSEVEHVLASQCLLQRRAKTLSVTFEGSRRPGVTAKDMILALIARIGVGGATGHVIEYGGSAVRALEMEARMTLCNMSIEAGARAGMIAPDDVTYEYLAGRELAPKGEAWDRALTRWRRLAPPEQARDAGPTYDREITVRANELTPMITFGTNPGMGIPIGDTVPRPEDHADAAEREAVAKALRYMGLSPGERLLGRKVDVVFIGSCTNGRISDLREAAQVFRGRKVKDGVRVLVVPGSQQVKRQAEAEGLDDIFRAAGASWREPGCSMCIAMNGDELAPGEYAVSSSNRNFEGRQGKGGRTFLASPFTCAASAVTGVVTDARSLL
jgi:3-isopropylmalate/(R)-2-methylmalate dehydratase large subunit